MARVLIINADDLGYDPAVTRGIVQAMREGVVTSATFMVNTPFSEAAAKEAQGLALGLHLNLARHPPVSDAFDEAQLTGGAFDEQRVGSLPTEALATEIRAQLDRLEALTGKPATHLDVHKHLHQHPNVLGAIIVVAQERALPVRSIDARMRAALRTAGVATNDHFIGDAGATAYWTLPQLEADLAKLEDGVTELMCHPGYAPSAVKSGYSAQREVELSTFTSPRARELLAGTGATLATFAVLSRR